MKSKFILLLVFLFSFFLGVLIEHTRPAFYVNVLETIKKYSTKIQISILEREEERICDIQRIQQIPVNTSLILGHLYGHPSVSSENPLGNIEEFIIQNQNKINSVIFTGDIFQTPSFQKWNYLIEFMKSVNIDFYIAPGNHDVGVSESTNRDIYNLTFNFQYPALIKDGNSIFLVDDSTRNNWSLSLDSFELINQNASLEKTLYILTHNIIFKEQLNYANSKEGFSGDIPSIKKLLKGYKDKYKNIVILSGDTGAFDFLPSKACYEYGNILGIANGFGNRKDNEAIIIQGDEIYTIEIN